ncbi:hypothetical protein CK222_19550 [Mesorhizobium sp. WSM3866]|uniref:hypothetical protein n=1 Tax=unclassified Mesorhizobium TaxID=325217 RepID=UPI000BAEFD57|nr:MULTISPECIES: hypothetical protein [unclassified Mesorhizobium]PBB42018.1 hypothetical protein CK222_19550 [Mesorhizobium sp. WSM3866]RWM92761.1 MAG: hypothetical protein EOR86_21625 [Mesorhizobium sp.]WIE90285.1 hypothetical protein P9270_022425 [Mesorhizobium sp. WSM4875]
MPSRAGPSIVRQVRGFESRHGSARNSRAEPAWGSSLARRYRAEKFREVGDRIIKNQLARHRREIAPDLDLGDAAALIETLLENVVHRAIERHPVSVAGERAMDQCRRMIMAYLTSVNRHAA